MNQKRRFWQIKRLAPLTLLRARGGRPTLYVPKIVGRLLAYIADGLNIKQACAAAGVSPRTLADWRVDHPEIVPRLEAAREASRAKALAKIKAASKDDWRSIAEWLRLSFSQDYMRGSTVNVSANANAASITESVELTDPERARLIKMRERALAGSPSADSLPAQWSETRPYSDGGADVIDAEINKLPLPIRYDDAAKAPDAEAP